MLRDSDEESDLVVVEDLAEEGAQASLTPDPSPSKGRRGEEEQARRPRSDKRRWSVPQFLSCAGQGYQDPVDRVTSIGPVGYRSQLDVAVRRDYSEEAMIRLETSIFPLLANDLRATAELAFRTLHVYGKPFSDFERRTAYMELCRAVAQDLDAHPFPSEEYFEESEIYWERSEVATKLGCSRQWVTELAARHSWKSRPYRGAVEYRADDVIRFMDSGVKDPEPKIRKKK